MSYRSKRRSRYYESPWPEYVPVAERRRRAAREMERLRKNGQPVSPVIIEGKKIATTFWGKAWCDNLEGYADFANRIERGRSYVRNGSVVDLQIAPNLVTATVSGSSLYQIKIDFSAVPKRQWSAICHDCAGGIDSLVELLQGRFSTSVMERICRQEDGLFPKPAEIRLKCSCPDWATMCKHVAAVLYGVGARLDRQPELLFRLRAVDENELVAQIDSATPLAKSAPAAGKVLAEDDLSALFGLDMGGTDAAAAEAVVPAVPAARKSTRTLGKKAAGKKAAGKIGKTAAAKDTATKKVAAANNGAVEKRTAVILAAKSVGTRGRSPAAAAGKPEAVAPPRPGAAARPKAAKRAAARRVAALKRDGRSPEAHIS